MRSKLSDIVDYYDAIPVILVDWVLLLEKGDGATVGREDRVGASPFIAFDSYDLRVRT